LLVDIGSEVLDFVEPLVNVVVAFELPDVGRALPSKIDVDEFVACTVTGDGVAFDFVGSDPNIEDVDFTVTPENNVPVVVCAPPATFPLLNMELGTEFSRNTEDVPELPPIPKGDGATFSFENPEPVVVTTGELNMLPLVKFEIAEVVVTVEVPNIPPVDKLEVVDVAVTGGVANILPVDELVPVDFGTFPNKAALLVDIRILPVSEAILPSNEVDKVVDGFVNPPNTGVFMAATVDAADV